MLKIRALRGHCVRPADGVVHAQRDVGDVAIRIALAVGRLVALEQYGAVLERHGVWALPVAAARHETPRREDGCLGVVAREIA